ncbi:MAG TPA: PDR/VanB family oxidoreductase [Burkholderiaceae bacterium]|nr:PDR/VanB family oxidoreductase [Burkholderiaceae bacterium]
MTPQTLSLQVADARALNPLIRQLRLVAPDSAPLPGFTAGAHLRVQVTLPDGATDWRHYSLINFAADPHAIGAPREYVIAVRREDDGRGGSRFMHERVQVGDTLTIEVPKNEFPLRALDSRAVLIAGGIGITPITSMAAQRKAEGRPVRLHYAGRSRSVMAFVPELQQLLGDDLALHADDEAGAPLDIDAVLDGCAADDQLYICGPKVMLDTVLAKTQARGWTHERVHFELFTTPVVAAGDQPIDVVLAQSGKTVTVPANQTILDCLIEHGCDPLFDCKRGECGVCSTAVIEGDIDHRDYFLSDAEKKSNKVMQICVSRARGARLVLDI